MEDIFYIVKYTFGFLLLIENGVKYKYESLHFLND